MSGSAPVPRTTLQGNVQESLDGSAPPEKGHHKQKGWVCSRAPSVMGGN